MDPTCGCHRGYLVARTRYVAEVIEWHSGIRSVHWLNIHVARTRQGGSLHDLPTRFAWIRPYPNDLLKRHLMLDDTEPWNPGHHDRCRRSPISASCRMLATRLLSCPAPWYPDCARPNATGMLMWKGHEHPWRDRMLTAFLATNCWQRIPTPLGRWQPTNERSEGGLYDNEHTRSTVYCPYRRSVSAAECGGNNQISQVGVPTGTVNPMCSW